MLKAIKIRLYPNNTQEIYINKLLGCYRKIFNMSLDYKKSKYIDDKSSIGLKELGNKFHQEWTKNEDFYYLQEHNTKVLKQSIINVLDAYKRFFVNGNGFPKFKSKHNNKQSCRFPVDAISTMNDYLTSKLTLTKQIKNIKFECSNEYKEYLNKNKEGIRSATLTKTKTNKYFLSILVDGDITKTLNKPNNDIIGIDLGVKTFVVCSDGTIYENLKIQRLNERKLARLHRNLSRTQKGSKNREKVRIKLASYNEKLNNIKENYLHEVSNKILNENQVIVMEDLNVSGMLKNGNLSRSIQEMSWSRFKTILVYKSEWYDRKVIEIDRWFPSSKLCSCCSYKNNELTLKDRIWICPKCNTNHDRDFNASMNIKNEGYKILIGGRPTEYKACGQLEELDESRNK